MNPHQVLLVFAFVLAFLAAIPYPYAAAPNTYWPWTSRLIAASLACYFASIIF